jgi:hypothetical protein
VAGDTTYMGVFANTFGKDWNYKIGYGLIDAQAALNKLLSCTVGDTIFCDGFDTSPVPAIMFSPTGSYLTLTTH